MKLKLVEDWRRGWRWISVNCIAVVVAVQGAWMAMPDDLKAGIPSSWVSGVSVATLVLGALGRFIKQGGADADKPAE
ncbi:DUF7940 domain-containing protein [Bordetella petrii]|uniref:DUF7940 domain-containing protein n=1 Tax=Bordetella petrii TaxID=94624 RepID=UPI0002D5ECF0|nr:hypothetical protein [Bordetella petrii]